MQIAFATRLKKNLICQIADIDMDGKGKIWNGPRIFDGITWVGWLQFTNDSIWFGHKQCDFKSYAKWNQISI